MIDFKQLQKDVYQNKINHGFNVTDVNYEFCLAYAEMAEAYEAWLKTKGNVGEELADVMIFIMGIAEILDINLEEELINKMNINSKRVYKKVNGVPIKVENHN